MIAIFPFESQYFLCRIGEYFKYEVSYRPHSFPNDAPIVLATYIIYFERHTIKWVWISLQPMVIQINLPINPSKYCSLPKNTQCAYKYLDIFMKHSIDPLGLSQALSRKIVWRNFIECCDFWQLYAILLSEHNRLWMKQYTLECEWSVKQNMRTSMYCCWSVLRIIL